MINYEWPYVHGGLDDFGDHVRDVSWKNIFRLSANVATFQTG